MIKIAISRFFAISLVLVLAGGLTGCNQMQGERVGEETGTVTERETAGPVGEDQDAISTETGMRDEDAGRAGTTNELRNLQPNQTLGYYTTQFEQRGYQIRDMDVQDDRVVYELEKNNQTQRVVLTRPEGSNRIQRVEIQDREARMGANSE
jgi:hypothetical protein